MPQEASLQKYRSTGIQEYRSTGVQEYSIVHLNTYLFACHHLYEPAFTCFYLQSLIMHQKQTMF